MSEFVAGSMSIFDSNCLKTSHLFELVRRGTVISVFQDYHADKLKNIRRL